MVLSEAGKEYGALESDPRLDHENWRSQGQGQVRGLDHGRGRGQGRARGRGRGREQGRGRGRGRGLGRGRGRGRGSASVSGWPSTSSSSSDMTTDRREQENHGQGKPCPSVPKSGLSQSSSSSAHQQMPPRSAAQREWSEKLWGGAAREQQKIGIGRATGVSRVPDGDLVGDPARIEHMACALAKQVAELEESGLSLIDGGAAKSSETWEKIVSDFRVLTMSITAAGVDRAPADSELRLRGIYVYESAADAAILAGNLAFYLTCQSRLLKDLYPRSDLLTCAPASRAAEFHSYSLLYFACFAKDSLEVVSHCREMSLKLAQHPGVKFSLAVASVVDSGDYAQFFGKFYSRGNRKQRTIMQPALAAFRRQAMLVMARAYRSLSSAAASEWLGLESEKEALSRACLVDAGPEEVRQLLIEELPELASINSVEYAKLLQFRHQRG